MTFWNTRCLVFTAVAVFIAAAAGCGSSTSGATGGSTSSGTKASSSTNASSTGSTSPASSSSTGGGTSGASSSGTGAGGSDAGAGCLAASVYAGLFTISDPAFCAVAVYTADQSIGSSSWGTHGGPLAFTADEGADGGATGGLTLQRWTPPAGAMGAMTLTTTDVAGVLPAGAVANSPVNDLPFFSWTAVSWTNLSATPATGSIDLVTGSVVAPTYAAAYPFAVAGVTAASGGGRLLYTGESTLGTTTTGATGLYAADACSSPMEELGAGTGCAPSLLIDAWDDYAGPLVVDTAGNAFAVLSSMTSTQEARGYAAAQVAKGAPAVKGTTLFTLTNPSYAGGLAALAPTSTASGLLVFQPIDESTSDALDVIEQPYTVTSGAIATPASYTTLLTVPTSMTGLLLMNDSENRLWVGVAGATSTTYVVLSRAP